MQEQIQDLLILILFLLSFILSFFLLSIWLKSAIPMDLLNRF